MFAETGKKFANNSFVPLVVMQPFSKKLRKLIVWQIWWGDARHTFAVLAAEFRFIFSERPFAAREPNPS